MFITYAKSNEDFMQLRYIDKDGFEKLRVDRNKSGDKPFLISKNRLQNKSNRYYFADSKSKELEKVWFSAMDLNKERGKVEVPYKPTFRAMLPIKHNGEFAGILIINYLIEGFLQKFTKAPLYDMILCDDSGDTIFHYDHDDGSHEKCWGNSLEHKYNISKDFPDDFKQILSSDILHTDTYVSRKFDLPIYGGLNLILQLKKSYVKQEVNRSQMQYTTTAIVVFIISLILTYIIIKMFSKKLLNIKQLENINGKLEETNDELEASFDSVSKMSSALETQKARYESLMTLSNEGVFIMSPNKGELVEYNDTTINLLGYNEDEMKKLTVFDWDKEIKTTDEWKEIVSHVGFETISFERVHTKKDGSTYTASIQAKKIMLNDELYIYATVRDITQQKNLRNQIIKEKDIAQKYLDLSGSMIIALNDKGEVTLINRVGCEILETSEEEVIGQNWFEKYLLVEDVEMVKGYFQKIMNSKVEAVKYVENQIITAKGKTKLISWHNSIIEDNGKIVGVLSSGLDITEKREQENKLQELNKNLEKEVEKKLKELREKEQLLIQQSKLASMGEMIGSIAHQWRQPLNSLSIQKEYVLDCYFEGDLTDEDMEKYDHNVNDLLQYMSKTIDDFRNFFRPSKEKEDFNLVESIKNILNILEAQLKQHMITLNINNHTEDSLSCYGYPNEFKQVIINIVNNAKDAIIGKNLKDGQIDIDIDSDENHITIEISDNAGGVPQDIIDRIFEPYFTTKFESQGTGLGLYMSKTIIETNMNGKMSVNNNDKGAVFTILLNKNYAIEEGKI
jgi:PAS domain S-box-containing protein